MIFLSVLNVEITVYCTHIYFSNCIYVSTRKRNIFAHDSGVVKTKSPRNENEYDRTASPSWV